MNRTEKRTQKTRSRIVETALRLFQQQGYEETSMEQIARESDVAKGTLYHHFPVKEAILNTYIQQTFQARQADRLTLIRSLPDTRARLQVIFDDLLAGVRRAPEIFEHYLVYRMQLAISFRKDPAMGSGLETLVQEILTLGKTSGELRSDLPLELLTENLEFTFIAAVKPLFLDPEHYDPQSSLDQCLSLLMDGAGEAARL